MRVIIAALSFQIILFQNFCYTVFPTFALNGEIVIIAVV